MIRIGTVITGAAIVLILLGCAARFDFTRYTSNQEIFQASLAALNEGKEGLAVQGFERLRDVIPQRDPLRPLLYYYLGIAYSRQKDHPRAANELRQVHALFSTDTIADDALLLAAREYRKMWRHVELDEEYGLAARQLLSVLLTSYPDTPLREEVFREDAELEDLLAQKIFEVGMDHYRRGQYPSADFTFKEAVERYPATPTAKRARIMTVQSLRRLRWMDDVEDQCVILRQMYNSDPEIRDLCGGAPPPITRAR
jgi:outer membrane assembly lipoprotein YfiO